MEKRKQVMMDDKMVEDRIKGAYPQGTNFIILLNET